MEQWEYKSVKFETTGFSGGILDLSNFDSQLNHYGRDGWELVSPFNISNNKLSLPAINLVSADLMF